jgi:tetratricopeptide (TPR) repeat protein
VKRVAVLVVLLVAYAAFLERRLVSEGPARIDPVGPRAREVEQAIGTGRFADALPVALELGSSSREPLVAYWLALIYHGLGRPADEIESWERFIDRGGAPADACPGLADAAARLGDAARALSTYERCVSLDPQEPERLIDLGDALERADRPREALDAFQRALALDSRNPVVDHRIERVKRGGAGQP